MTSSLALIVLGFFLGMRHATDPDHVIAVTTIVAREKTRSSATAIGAAWGLGHTFTILVVGGGIILFGWVIPPRIGLSMEFSVGLMLILLGIMNLSGLMRLFGTTDLTGSAAHKHTHWLDRHLGGLHSCQFVRPLIVGVVHGLAGSAAVALLVLTTVQDPRWGVWYLLVFGIGTIVGMILMTTAIAIPFARTGDRFAHFGGALRIASGVISLGFGLFVAYHTGFADGLFTGMPNWIPQ
jgi:sulfite exporter TauE/SafE